MNAAHVHLAINHAPLFGVLAGIVLLGWGVLRGSAELRLASYAAFIISALIALAVYFTGGVAESIIEDLPGVAESAIERHEDIAKIAVFAICVTGVLAGAAFFVERSALAIRRSVPAGLFLAAFVALGVVGYAANLGGQIRHPEITARQ